ncbi:MAG: hypothetical protein KC731_33090 [Myxococcales bacterium]|nr:hypothetical protein [Myxococcales bacterium]
MFKKTQPAAWMNGYTSGTVTGAWRRADSVVVVVCFNRDFPGGWYEKWVEELDLAVNSVPPNQWGSHDYFEVVLS